jgi:hypothetical protein
MHCGGLRHPAGATVAQHPYTTRPMARAFHREGKCARGRPVAAAKKTQNMTRP